RKLAGTGTGGPASSGEARIARVETDPAIRTGPRPLGESGSPRRGLLRVPDFDLVAGGRPRFAAEAPWAWRLLRRWLRELPAAVRTEVPGRDPLVRDARGAADLVLVHADPEAFLPPRSGERLLRVLADDASLALVLPVSNEPQVDEARRVPAFAYSTPSALLEAAASLAADAPPLRSCAAPKSPVYAVRREALRALPAELPLAEAPERISAAGG